MSWIYVEDELPKKDETVVCTLKDESICLALYKAEEKKFYLDIVYDNNDPNYQVVAYHIVPEFYPEPELSEAELEEQQRREARDFYIDMKIDESRGK